MKRIGLIGGMSFESTLDYYTRINQRVNVLADGELASADMVLRSVNFDEYCKLIECDDWETITERLINEIELLDVFGCDYVALCTNTMHKVADEIEETLFYATGQYGEDGPFVHIGDCVAEKCIEAGVKRVALIGTRITMTDRFMKDRLEANGLEVVNNFTNEQIERIDQLIFDELCQGVIRHSMEFLRDLCYDLAKSGEVDGIVLGCTELGIVLDKHFSRQLDRDHHVLLFDTTQAHIEKLVELCLSD